MTNNHDISSINDIKQLVDTFYTKVQKDNLIGEIFNRVIQDNWSTHLEKMYRFWQTILLEQHTYSGSPFTPHAKLPIGKSHFKRWLTLFIETVDELFVGEKADEAKWRANKMAEMFQLKIEFYQNNSAKPL